MRSGGEEKDAAISAALNVTDTWFATKAKAKETLPAATDKEFWGSVGNVLEEFNDHGGMDSYYWNNICHYALNAIPDLVIRKACEALTEELDVRGYASEL